jgi:hypothetical protein
LVVALLRLVVRLLAVGKRPPRPWPRPPLPLLPLDLVLRPAAALFWFMLILLLLLLLLLLCDVRITGVYRGAKNNYSSTE